MKTFAYAPQRSRMAKMARMEMAEAMPVLCRTLVARASGGDMTAMRLIWQMAMFDERRKGSAAARRAARRQNDAWAKKEWKELTAGLDEAASTDGDGAVQG